MFSVEWEGLGGVSGIVMLWPILGIFLFFLSFLFEKIFSIQNVIDYRR